MVVQNPIFSGEVQVLVLIQIGILEKRKKKKKG